MIPAIFINLLVFATLSFFQNAAFTWSSRSRNSNDPAYHRKASWASNGVFYVTNVLLTLYIIKYHTFWMLALQGLVYTLATAEGSVAMMRRLIGKEKGKQKVGNQFTPEEVEVLRRVAAKKDGGGVNNVVVSVNFSTEDQETLRTMAQTFRENFEKVKNIRPHVVRIPEYRNLVPSIPVEELTTANRESFDVPPPFGKDSVGE